MTKKRGIRRSTKHEKIENKESMRVSLVKRRKGILKKCIELNVMCQQEIFLFTFDRTKQKVL